MTAYKGYFSMKRIVGALALAAFSLNAAAATPEEGYGTKAEMRLVSERIQEILGDWNEKSVGPHPAVESFRGDRERQVPLFANIVKEEGTLFFSDSPEYVKEEGILCSGTMEEGKGRIYFYHVNDTKTVKRMALVMRSMSDQPMEVQMQNTMLSGPSPQYFDVGRSLSLQELLSQKGEVMTEKFATDKKYKKADGQAFTLQPFEKKEIWTELGDVLIEPEALISGMVDFTTTGPVQVSVMMLDKGHDVQNRDYFMKILPHTEGHLRGTFTGVEREIEVIPAYDPSVGTAYVELANGRELPFLQGYDETMTGAHYRFLGNMKNSFAKENLRDRSQNTGDYGVSQHVRIPTKNTGYYDLYFNPLGGAYAGYIRVTVGDTSEIFSVPDRSLPYIGHQTIDHMVYVGTYRGGEELQIDFMSAGASNLPIRFILYPAQAPIQ